MPLSETSPMPQRLWITDDDPIFIFGMKHRLEALTCLKELVFFNDGEDLQTALEQLSEESFPDLIFLDIHMPCMNGWEVLEILEQKKKPEHCKLYLVSSSINPLDHAKAKQYRWVDAFVTKPLGNKELKGLLALCA